MILRNVSKRMVIVVVLFVGLAPLSPVAGAKVRDLPGLVEAGGVTGGVILHLGCADSRQTASLYSNESVVVHGLERDPRKVAAARAYLMEQGLYGPVSVEQHTGPLLPHADNTVNAVFVHDTELASPEEIMRVLVPQGIAFFWEAGQWQKQVKARPAGIDEWTHFLHDADNNAVARDERVGPPRHLQWLASPLWLRSHETPSGVQAMVTGAGRFFYIFDEGVIGVTDERLPDRWAIYARDAFNGKLLWKRSLKAWGWRQWGLDKWAGKDWTRVRAARVGVPATNHRRLVVYGDRLYTTLSFDDPVSVLNAASGQTQKVLEGTAGAREILTAKDYLIIRTEGSAPALIAFETTDYQEKWRHAAPRVSPCQIAIAGDSVYYSGAQELVALELCDGQTRWRVPTQARPRTLVAQDQAVLLLGNTLLEAFNPSNGQPLWKDKVLARQGWEADDLFVIDGLVWTGTHQLFAEGQTGRKSEDALALGRDLLTGAVKRRVEAQALRSPEHHHRCYRNKATSRYLISSYEGAEFLDTEADNHLQHNWIRGACTLGMMPANGMLYVPPDQCFCSPGAKLLGFTALTEAGVSKSRTVPDALRLSKGPAYGQVLAIESRSQSSGSGWPTYRADAARRGTTPTPTSLPLEDAWETQLGGRLTAPVAWQDTVYVAQQDRNILHALDIESGRTRWTFIARAGIDSPPTIHQGHVLLGARDGRVYCLRAADGALAWSFLAAPYDRRICALERLESAWPLHGSVLVLNDLAYVAAGRSTYLDGGISLWALDIPTGRIVHRGRFEGPHTKTGERNKGFYSPGANADILTAQDGYIYMRQLKLTPDLKEIPIPVLSSKGAQDVGLHVFATSGMLDDSWYNRTYWMYSQRWPGFQLANQAPKAGQLLVVDDDNTYAVKVFYRRNVHSSMFFPGKQGYLLFADRNANEPQIVGESGAVKPLPWLPQSDYDYANTNRKTGKGKIVPLDQNAFGYDKGIGYTRAEPPLWSLFLPIRIKAMVKADSTIFVAGQPDMFDARDPYAGFEGRRGAMLAAVSADKGEKLLEKRLAAPPVFDGMIAAYGRIVLCLKNGQVICLRSHKKGLAQAAQRNDMRVAQETKP
jgi:outer membrane protein assembly factor BamB